MTGYLCDVAFTPSVKAEQEKRGSRASYARMAERSDWSREITPDLAAFIAERRSFYLATSNSVGQPYIQHRGGPKGFLHILGPSRLGFADFAGNKQYITLGNLKDNDRAYIFLMDYANQIRVKIWGQAEVKEEDEDLIARLSPKGYDAKPERAFLFTIDAWSANCNQHIPRLYDEETVAAATQKMSQRISALEEELERLRAQLSARNEKG